MNDIAVGILVNENRQVLLARVKPPRKYAHCWEFPGGKLEDAETFIEALHRELREELKVDLITCRYLTECYADDWVVRFYAVTKFMGEPTMIEHSALAWVDINAVCTYPLLHKDCQMRAVFELMKYLERKQ